jgi:hypothetical protein
VRSADLRDRGVKGKDVARGTLQADDERPEPPEPFVAQPGTYDLRFIVFRPTPRTAASQATTPSIRTSAGHHGSGLSWLAVAVG